MYSLQNVLEFYLDRFVSNKTSSWQFIQSRVIACSWESAVPAAFLPLCRRAKSGEVGRAHCPKGSPCSEVRSGSLQLWPLHNKSLGKPLSA
jgi:hypothetical protein